MSECVCVEWSLTDHTLFDRTFIGVDKTAGRFADVELERCHRCGRYWLRYYWEMEAFSRCGRWYRGVITEEQAQTVTPDNAASLLESLEWYLVGGSYYEGKIHRSSGPVT